VVKILEVRSNNQSRSRPWAENLAICAGGAVAALLTAFAYSVWDNSIEAEAYAPAIFLMLATFWLSLQWKDTLGQAGGRKLLLLCAYLWGVGVGIHLAALQIGFAIFIFALLVQYREILDVKFLLLGALLFLLGVSVHAYLPIRAALGPSINECNPSTWDNFWYVLGRKQYEPFNFSVRRADFWGYQFGHMFLRYFLWQWSALKLSAIPQTLRAVVTTIIYALGLVGIYAHLKRGEKTLTTIATFLLVAALPVFLLMFILKPIDFYSLSYLQNTPGEQYYSYAFALVLLAIVLGIFANGFPQGDRTFVLLGLCFVLSTFVLAAYFNMVNPQVRERDYFFAPAFMFFAMWMGLGAWQVLAWLRSRLPEMTSTIVPAGSLLLAGLTFLPMASIYHEKDRSLNWIPAEYGRNILDSCAEGGIIFTNGDNDTFPLWFVQEVENFRKDVRVVNLSLANTPWYLEQLKANGVPMNFSEAQIKDVMPIRSRDGRIFGVNTLAVRDIIAANTNKGLENILEPDSIWVRNVLTDYRGRYPIYFAVTVSDENLMGTQPHLELEGLAYRVVPHVANRAPNVERTRYNLYHVYSFSSVLNPRVYKDDNTQKLVSNYASAFWQLGRALRARGDMGAAVREFEKAKEISPTEPANLNWLGITYAEMGNYPRAIENLEGLVRLDPRNPYVHAQLASVYQVAGRPRDAVASLRQAIELNPDFGEGFGRLFFLYVEQGDTLGAMQTLETWLARHPQDTRARMLLSEYRAKYSKTSNRAPLGLLPSGTR
jgi:tetratricopeptide (TPR) repeat protein